jgi:SAM-dependent methyltransferase
MNSTSESPAASDLNRYADSYGDEVQSSISFTGADHEYFTQVKARHLLELASRRLGDPGALQVADIGCGVGETDRFLEGSFKHLIGLDIAPDMIERAGQRNPWAEYRSYRPSEPLPLDDESVDLSFAICVLHHVPVADRERFVAEMRRVTKPGGIVVIFEHNPWNPLTRLSVHRCEFDEGVVLLSRRRARHLLAGQRLERLESPYIVFFTRPGRRRERIERALKSVPAGAQYFVAARRTLEHG